MAPVNITDRIAAILKLLGDVLRCLGDAKDASKVRRQCSSSSIYTQFFTKSILDRKGGPSQRWDTAVRALTAENGPLDQFNEGLEMLQDKLTNGDWLKQVGEAVV